MLRASQVNAPNHNNLDMPFNGEDKLTCARLSLGASAFPIASSSLGAWQLKVPGRRNTLKYLRCSKPKPSTSQSLKHDSCPQKNQQSCSSSGGPTGFARKLGAVGRRHFQARKTQAILASPGWASTVAVLPHCKRYKDERAAASDKPPCAQHDAAQKLLEQGQGRSQRDRCQGPRAQIRGQKPGPSRSPKKEAATWTRLP